MSGEVLEKPWRLEYGTVSGEQGEQAIETLVELKHIQDMLSALRSQGDWAGSFAVTSGGETLMLNAANVEYFRLVEPKEE